MSVGYVPVQWNRHKRVYDALLAAGVLLYLAIFFAVGKRLYAAAHSISDEILLLRALGTCAFLLLHIILCIGPLARLNPRFLPLLFNRRHLGVTMFLVALAHGAFATVYYHGFGKLNPLVSLLAINAQYDSLARFPYQLLGAAALLILFLMAATSHDFWLKNLSARVWKSLHMLVYVAYALLVLHVVLGALQDARGALPAALLIVGVAVVTGLHLLAGLREHRRDRGGLAPDDASDDWAAVCRVDEIPELRAKVVCIRGRERIAVFRYGGQVSAVTNVCAHQGGPLGEGRIIDGCITCPWHGWQYQPAEGQSPPPFTERIATHDVRLDAGRVFVRLTPNPPGTPVPPAQEECLGVHSPSPRYSGETVGVRGEASAGASGGVSGEASAGGGVSGDVGG